MHAVGAFKRLNHHFFEAFVDFAFGPVPLGQVLNPLEYETVTPPALAKISGMTKMSRA